MHKTLEINFCFGLVCKVVVEVQRNSIQMQKKTRSFRFYFVNLFHEFIPFIPFVHLFAFLCYGERR